MLILLSVSNETIPPGSLSGSAKSVYFLLFIFNEPTPLDPQIISFATVREPVISKSPAAAEENICSETTESPLKDDLVRGILMIN